VYTLFLTDRSSSLAWQLTLANKSERIESSILIIRGHKVILDSELAILYAVNVGRLNEAVKRNRDRFSADFMFQLSREELIL
jgi:hypothetical protein